MVALQQLKSGYYQNHHPVTDIYLHPDKYNGTVVLL